MTSIDTRAGATANDVTWFVTVILNKRSQRAMHVKEHSTM